jgi:hypothetical protein
VDWQVAVLFPAMVHLWAEERTKKPGIGDFAHGLHFNQHVAGQKTIKSFLAQELLVRSHHCHIW